MTYESALIDQAEREKCSQSTFSERKIMKTAFKRVALVAAAALAIGGVSAVSANAVAPQLAATSTISQVGLTGDGGVGGIAGPANTLKISVVNGQTAGGTAGDLPVYVTITGGSFSAASPANTGLSAAAVTQPAGTTTTYTVLTPTVGTIVINTYDETTPTSGLFAATPTSTKSITVRATGINGVISLANTTAFINASTNPAVSPDATIAVASTPASSHAAWITVTALDGNSVAVNDSLTASVSGPGILVGNTTGRVVAGTATVGVTTFEVLSDGTAGTSTITIADGSTVVTTKTLTFTGAVAKAVASNNGSIVNLTGTADSGAAEVHLTDANGNSIVSQAANIVVTSSDTTVLASKAAGASNCAADTTSGNGYYTCDVTGVSGIASGKSATVTFSVGTLATSNAITFTTGDSTIAALALTTDAATYAPGNTVALTIAATDSSGNPVADGSYGIFYNAATTSPSVGVSPLTASASLTSSPFSIAGTTLEKYTVNGGKVSAKFYAPYTDGTVSLSGTTGTTGSGLAAALQGTAVSASFTVSTGASDAANAATDAANEATDAANAATDAANAAADSADAATQAAQDAGDKADAALAAVTALSQQVTTVLAKVAALAATLAKITAAIAKLPKK
jgi:hypothetical protein